MLLRPPREPDLGCLLEALQDKVIQRYLPDMALLSMPSRARAWITRVTTSAPAVAGCWTWVISDRSGSSLLGVIEMAQAENGMPVAEIGYWLKASARGHGVASRALCLVVRWGLLEAGCEGLRITSNVHNEASAKLAHRCGFSTERVCAGMVRYSLSRQVFQNRESQS